LRAGSGEALAASAAICSLVRSSIEKSPVPVTSSVFVVFPNVLEKLMTRVSYLDRSMTLTAYSMMNMTRRLFIRSA
jgi:hypothetical protein